jgi:predicted PolB exonuclease-like 3'-5' exonuclease
VPVAVAVARVSADYRILDVANLDSPRFDPRAMVELFWRGVEHYRDAVLVDFNGRGFDIPLLTLAAFRFGISCPRYFDDPDRFGFRYRFTSRHLDLMEWITEYGAFRLRGGLDLLAKILGKPGKLETSGGQVQDLYDQGRLQDINDYCLHDVLDTYFVFLRTRVLTGRLALEREQELVEEARKWLGERGRENPALEKYLENFGSWEPTPFV